MTWYPLETLPRQHVDANGDPYSGAVLKAYSAGTSTVINMATDYTGGTTATSFALNASGYIVSGGAVIIPHVEEDCKLALYPTQAAADANSGAIWTYDNIQVATSANADRIVAHAEDTGSADTYVMAPDPAISAYEEGQIVTLQPANTNTGTSTLALSGLAAKTIKTPGGANLSANMLLAGGEYILIYDGTNFVLTNPSLSSGGSWVAIKTVTAANDASVSFVNGSAGVVLDSTYPNYVIVGSDVVPANDGVNLYLRTDSNAGASFDSGASDYSTTTGGELISGDMQGTTSTAAQIGMSNTSYGSAAGEGLNFVAYVFNPSGTALHKTIAGWCGGTSSGASSQFNHFSGKRSATAAIDAIQFLFSSGNIESGTFTLYGISGA